LRWDPTSSYIDGGIRLYLCLNDVSSTMSMRIVVQAANSFQC
jgi:hypothetical protein